MSAVERPLRWVINAIVGIRRQRGPLTVVSLVVILIAGIAYLSFVSLRVNPFEDKFHVNVELAESGGLLVGQDVTVRGIPVGRVKSIELGNGNVVAGVSIDSRYDIPVDSAVRVSGLSAAGEQYLDFRPSSTDGPYLTDGSVVAEAQTSTPIGLAKLLDDLRGVSKQIDIEKLNAIVDELHMGPEGPQKLGAIFDGGIFLVSTLDSVLPQTVSVLNESKTVLGTLADVRSGLIDTAGNLNSVLSGAARMDGGLRTLLDTGPGALGSLDALFADNSPTMVQLLGNLTTIAQLAYIRVPALNALLLPTDRGSTLEALTSIIHDGGIWASAEIYPRYSCDYNLPRSAPSDPSFQEPYLYTYCADEDPSVLVRGAHNAPRPEGDDTAGPPPGVDPLQTADPTPIGPNTLPTNPGGPPLPIAPPR